MKYFYRRDDIPEHFLTPAYSAGKGKIVAGERIVFLDSIYASERPVMKDKKIGSVSHFHPEEHIAYNIGGGRRFAVGGKWYDLKPGDVSVSLPYVPHEGNSEKVYRVLNFKDRINGHSIYKYGAWEPGAEEFFKRIEALIEEGKKLPSSDPWFADIAEVPIYTWDKMNEYPEARYSSGMAKVIVGDKLLLIKTAYREKPDGELTGCKPHSHPEEEIVQLVAGKAEFRVGNEWFTPEVGDMILAPADMEHEIKGGGAFETITLKNRVYGHNISDDTWCGGGEKLHGELSALYAESKKFPNVDPWFLD